MSENLTIQEELIAVTNSCTMTFTKENFGNSSFAYVAKEVVNSFISGESTEPSDLNNFMPLVERAGRELIDESILNITEVKTMQATFKAARYPECDTLSRDYIIALAKTALTTPGSRIVATKKDFKNIDVVENAKRQFGLQEFSAVISGNKNELDEYKNGMVLSSKMTTMGANRSEVDDKGNLTLGVIDDKKFETSIPTTDDKFSFISELPIFLETLKSGRLPLWYEDTLYFPSSKDSGKWFEFLNQQNTVRFTKLEARAYYCIPDFSSGSGSKNGKICFYKTGKVPARLLENKEYKRFMRLLEIATKESLIEAGRMVHRLGAMESSSKSYGKLGNVAYIVKTDNNHNVMFENGVPVLSYIPEVGSGEVNEKGNFYPKNDGGSFINTEKQVPHINAWLNRNKFILAEVDLKATALFGIVAQSRAITTKTATIFLNKDTFMATLEEVYNLSKEHHITLWSPDLDLSDKSNLVNISIVYDKNSAKTGAVICAGDSFEVLSQSKDKNKMGAVKGGTQFMRKALCDETIPTMVEIVTSAGDTKGVEAMRTLNPDTILGKLNAKFIDQVKDTLEYQMLDDSEKDLYIVQNGPLSENKILNSRMAKTLSNIALNCVNNLEGSYIGFNPIIMSSLRDFFKFNEGYSTMTNSILRKYYQRDQLLAALNKISEEIR